MPVIAKMPNGEFRLVWADPDAEIALKLCGSARAYIVEMKTEEDFERLRRLIADMEKGKLEGN